MIAVSPSDKVKQPDSPSLADQDSDGTAPHQNIIYLNQTDFDAFWHRVNSEPIGPTPELRELVKNYRATVCSQ